MWIKVTDFLPEIKWRLGLETKHPDGRVTRRAGTTYVSDFVLIYGSWMGPASSHCYVARLKKRKSGKMDWDTNLAALFDITHWMPLPAPPTADISGTEPVQTHNSPITQ